MYELSKVRAKIIGWYQMGGEHSHIFENYKHQKVHSTWQKQKKSPGCTRAQKTNLTIL